MRKFKCSAQDPEYKQHDGKKCEIVKQLGPDVVDMDEVGYMYRIRFADGTEIDAFADEIEA